MTKLSVMIHQWSIFPNKKGLVSRSYIYEYTLLRSNDFLFPFLHLRNPYIHTLVCIWLSGVSKSHLGYLANNHIVKLELFMIIYNNDPPPLNYINLAFLFCHT